METNKNDENSLHVHTEKKSGAKMAPPWSCFKSGAVFSLIIMFDGGHPVDIKMAPPWNHFGSTFFFQCMMYKLYPLRMAYSPVKAPLSNISGWEERPSLKETNLSQQFFSTYIVNHKL